MTTYDASAVSNTVIAHKKGITLQQGRALRDNPIAITEGSETAPKIAGAAFGTSFWMGFRTASPATYTQDLGNTRWLKIENATSVTEIALSNDGGATWGAAQSLDANRKYIDLQTGNTVNANGVVVTSDFTPLSGCNAVRFTITAAPGDPVYIDLYAIQGRTSW
jgi:hypothetical protein